MIRGVNISLSFNNEAIYEDATFSIMNNQHVGVVGVNGAGKTTLFKLILKQLEVDKGYLIVNESHIGYLPQEIELPDLDETIFDYIYSGRPIKELNNKLDEIYKKIEINNDPELLKEAGKINSLLEYYNQYNAENELIELLDDLNIPLDMVDRKLNTLSGGQKSKMTFARLLFSKPEILLLDEPTNHLDKESKELVINYLKKYKGTYLVISHDIDFLNDTVDNILFINKVTHKISLYHNNYTEFKRIYAEEMMLKEARILQQEKEIEKLKAFVKMCNDASVLQFKLKRQGKSRQKLLDKKLQQLEVRDKEYKRVKMDISPTKEGGKVPVEVNDLTFGYPGSINLYEKLSFSLSRNERFLIVGENGIGKSTLLKLIVGLLKPNEGSIHFSMKTTISYYAQELEILNQDKNVIENLVDNRYTEKELRAFLGNFLFKGDDVYKTVKVLSPGEKARLALCKILLEKRNLIILDEPTNHFDPDTQKIIGENFKDFEGTLIVVSHNPKFVEEIGITRMLTLPDGRIMNYSRELLNYYYYLNTDF